MDITLEDVAVRAQVSVQTVLRHFGSRDGLLDAAVQSAQHDVVDERRTPPGDVDAAVITIVDHYERRGDFLLRLLAQEFADERIRAVVEPGRQLHQEWVSNTFAPNLTGRAAGEREALVDLLAVATDVYTWQLLRRHRMLSRDAVVSRMRQLVDALLSSPVVSGP